MATVKEGIINRILEILEVESKSDYTELTENLKKMGKPALDILLEHVDDSVGRKAKKERPKKLPALHVDATANDFFGATKQDEISDQLHKNTLVAERLYEAFKYGDIQGVKRNIQITEAITGNTRRLISKQLWENLDLFEDKVDDIFEEEDDE